MFYDGSVDLADKRGKQIIRSHFNDEFRWKVHRKLFCAHDVDNIYLLATRRKSNKFSIFIGFHISLTHSIFNFVAFHSKILSLSAERFNSKKSTQPQIYFYQFHYFDEIRSALGMSFHKFE